MNGHEEHAVMARVPPSPRLRRLLQDLESIMLTDGFLDLNTDEIARRLRCSKATLYRLAPSREELFEVVIERVLARLRDVAWNQLSEHDTWASKFTAFLIEPNRWWAQETSYKFVRDLHGFPGGQRLWHAHEKLRMDMLETIIEEGSGEGAFQPVHARLAADLILTTVKRAIEPDFAVSVGLSIPEAFEQWYRILEFGLIRSATDAERAGAIALASHDAPPKRSRTSKSRSSQR